MGLGIWSGFYEGVDGLWLRWYDHKGQWIPSDPERAEQEKERAEQEKERAEQAEAQVNVERERVQQEQQRAEQAEAQVNLERERAEKANQDYQALLKKLQDKGVDLDML